VSTRQNRQQSVLQSQLQTLEVTAGAPEEVQEKVRHREKLEKCATTPSFLFVRTKTQVLQSVPPSVRVSLSLANTESSSSNKNNKAARNTLQKSSTTATTAASNEHKAKSLGMAPNKRERNRAEPQKKRQQEDSGARKGRPDFNNVYLIFMECLVGM
jgi:hypothetical protein